MATKNDALRDFFDAFTDACLSEPLYGHITVPHIEGLSPVDRLFRAQLQFDGHCVHCEKDSVFWLAESLEAENKMNVSSAGFPDTDLHFFRSTFCCTRMFEHQYTYFWQYVPGAMVKVGQNPSLETIASNDVKQYRKILGPQYFSELHRATGLASHGIGIGAFVYLRRIFERLISEHRELVEKRDGPISGFDGMRMSEKIDALKTELPDTVVRYRAAYGILSKGIHELSEDECKQYFPVLRSAIVAILEQDLQNRVKREKEQELEDEMQRIIGSLGNGGGAKP